jgi:hypothetical protein
MNARLKGVLSGTLRFFGKAHYRGLLFILILAAFALGEYRTSGFIRRSFVFYTLEDGREVVEDRMVSGPAGEETDIIRYVEEALLGPASQDSAPLFPRDTRLRSLLYREGVVYLDLSESAALPVPEGKDCYTNLYTLNEGIRRNFPLVQDVRLFIAGNEAYVEQFSRAFHG